MGWEFRLEKVLQGVCRAWGTVVRTWIDLTQICVDPSGYCAENRRN